MSNAIFADMWLCRPTGSTLEVAFVAIMDSSRPQTHWNVTYYPIILGMKQSSILRLKHEKCITKKILSCLLKSQSCKVLSTEAADPARHVHPLRNIRHANISIDVIIYVAGTTHMLKLAYALVLYRFGTKTLIPIQDQALLFYKL